MSFIESQLSNLKPKSDVATFVNSVQTYQQTTDYTKYVESQTSKNTNDIISHFCKIIISYFNNDDKNTFDANKPSLTLNIGALPLDDQIKLQNCLISKGYIVSIDNNIMTIDILQS